MTTTADTAARVRVSAPKLTDLVTDLFAYLKLPRDHARIAAEALVDADLRGHESHGVSNYIKMIYYPGLAEGIINPNPNMRIEHESPTTARWEADGAMGHVVAHLAMSDVIERAKKLGSGFAAVANSRHYGMAQHWAVMALEHDMIGITMTNGGALTVPFQGMEAKLGTNPIAVSIPAGEEPPFILDMATTTVAWGKIMNAGRDGVAIPTSWGYDSTGRPTTDPQAAMEAKLMLPLGGSREGSAHKGYGLSAWVEIFCGVLSGTGFGMQLGRDNVGHFFGAWRIDAFMPAGEFKSMMDSLLRDLKSTKPAPGFDRVLVAGVPEWETVADRVASGIPLHPTVIDTLREYADEVGAAFDLAL
jgi:LDH2 family malate/lactate/ureidoglycolate dehydrogenase